jgi:hypothetical protein
MTVPLSQLAAIDADESTQEAIGDWHYWVAQGSVFSEAQSRQHQTCADHERLDPGSHTGKVCRPRATRKQMPNPQRIKHIMTRRQPASKPTWAHVKAEPATFDRPGLLARPTRIIRGFFTPVLDWGRRSEGPTRKRSITGYGRMYYGARVLPS